MPIAFGPAEPADPPSLLGGRRHLSQASAFCESGRHVPSSHKLLGRVVPEGDVDAQRGVPNDRQNLTPPHAESLANLRLTRTRWFVSLVDQPSASRWMVIKVLYGLATYPPKGSQGSNPQRT